MPLSRLEHFLVLTDDLEATRDFYCRGLGLQVGPRPPLGFSGDWLYLGAVPCVHVAEWDSYRAYSTAAGISVSERAPGTGPVDHLAFVAVDCDGVRVRLERYGVKFAENFVPGANLTQFFMLDPNGVKVEINAATGTAAR
jgi:catechol 2,3-dioxygenase-like lactoylglutathione lyase family enzyme